MSLIRYLKPIIAARFPTMTGHEKRSERFDVGLDTPIIADVQAVTGFTNLDKPATAVYVTLASDGVRWRYDGKRWKQS